MMCAEKIFTQASMLNLALDCIPDHLKAANNLLICVHTNINWTNLLFLKTHIHFAKQIQFSFNIVQGCCARQRAIKYSKKVKVLDFITLCTWWSLSLKHAMVFDCFRSDWFERKESDFVCINNALSLCCMSIAYVNKWNVDTLVQTWL
jgi:hypothetical protein